MASLFYYAKQASNRAMPGDAALRKPPLFDSTANSQNSKESASLPGLGVSDFQPRVSLQGTRAAVPMLHPFGILFVPAPPRSADGIHAATRGCCARACAHPHMQRRPRSAVPACAKTMISWGLPTSKLSVPAKNDAACF